MSMFAFLCLKLDLEYILFLFKKSKYKKGETNKQIIIYGTILQEKFKNTYVLLY